MRDFILKLFSTTEGSVEITCFSIWHILYIVLIVGLTIGGAFILKNKSDKAKNITMRVLAYAVIGTYIADFFFMPLSLGYIDIDKLPFHICTAMAVLIPFAQFNGKFSKSGAKEVVVCLSIVSSLMYITYPGSALGGVTPWCYKVVQTMLFHGLVFAWGVLSLTTKQSSLKFKNIWKQLVGILVIMVWATIGNYIYQDYNWFFLKGGVFPFIPDNIYPLVILVAVFAMCAIIYSIDLGVKKIIAKRKPKENEDKKEVA